MVSEPPPIADFTANPTSGLKPLTVAFTDTSTGAITARVWTFGDGNTGAAQNPIHQYTSAGVFTVALQASGPGGTSLLTRTNYITVSEPSTLPPTLQLSPSAITFTAVLSGSAPAAQHLAVSIQPVSPTLMWKTSITATGGLTWLSVMPSSGSGDGVISVTVDATGLLTGTYYGTVSVADIAYPTDQVTAAVLLIVEPAPPMLDKRVWLPLITR